MRNYLLSTLLLILSVQVGYSQSERRPKNPSYASAVEVVEKRDAYSATFVNADKSIVKAYSSIPLHYQNASNQWEVIDYSFAFENQRWVFPKQVPQIVFMPQSGQTSFSINGNEVKTQSNFKLKVLNSNFETVSTKKAQRPSQLNQVNDHQLSYSLLPNLKANVFAAHDVLQHFYTIPQVDTQWPNEGFISLEYEMELPQNWFFRSEKGAVSGLISEDVYVIGMNGEVIAILPQPIIHDNKALHLSESKVEGTERPISFDIHEVKEQSTIAVSYLITPLQNGRFSVSILIPSSWLKDAERVYPVSIDPTIVVTETTNQPTCRFPTFNIRTMQVQVPAGDMVLSTYVEWDFLAVPAANAWRSEQRSFVSGPSGNTEVLSGSGNSPGLQSYALDTAVYFGVSDGQTVGINFHGARTWGGTGTSCNTTFQLINRRYIEITHVDSFEFGPGTVVINEYSASNRILPDSFGNFEDWVELYNTSNNFVNLDGFYLSDNPNNPTKWQFSNVFIAPNSYLRVYCSGRDMNVGNTAHTNFRLSQLRPESIIFSDPSGTVLESYTLWRTQNGHSYGRVTDGAADWGVFENPTLGAANANARERYTETPVFSVTSGFYNSAQTLTITTDEPNAVIRFTTNGADPIATSPLYTGPITVSQTQVVRARVFSNDPNIIPGFIETHTLFINAPNHQVPVVSVSGTQLQTLLGGNRQLRPIGSLEFFDENKAFIDKAVGEFRGHGQDSWSYPQRGMRFIARDEFGYKADLEYPFFETSNRTSFQRLILKAGASDNYPFENGGAHVRDAFIQHYSQLGELDLDERSLRFCALYVNGAYWGLYDMRELVNDNDYTEFYYNQDRKYNGSEENVQFIRTWGQTVADMGEQRAINEWVATRQFILNNDMSLDTNFENMSEQYNWRSLVDYFVVNSYVVSRDWLNYNTGWWRGLNPNGEARQWRYILWDMDASYGHYTNFSGIPDVTANALPCNVENLPNLGGQGHTLILKKLITENPTVRHYYITRYADLLNTLLSCQTQNAILDDLTDIMATEMPRHVARWGGSVPDWQSNVQNIRNFINQRCQAVATGLISCYNLTGPYQVNFSVQPEGAGEIKMNTIWLNEFPFNANVYGNIDTQLTAMGYGSFMFSHWEILNHNVENLDLTNPAIVLQLIENESIVAHFIDTNLGDDDLLYYWHFNTLNTTAGDVTSIPADFSFLPTAEPNLVYTGSGARDMDSFNTGTTINTYIGEGAGLAVRVRNPSANRTLVLNMPTTGYQDLIFEYAVQRSGSGMLNNIISYSTDGTNFIQTGLAQTSFSISEEYELVYVDFTNIAAANNNPNFKVRISFSGNTTTSNGNNRFDNFSLKGQPFVPLSVGGVQKDSPVKIYPNPASDFLFIDAPDGFTGYKLFDPMGRLIHQQSMSERTHESIPLSGLPNGMYVIQIEHKEGSLNAKFIKK